MSIILTLAWLLNININMVYSGSECPSIGCCHPKSMRANAETISECSSLGIHDCMLLYGSTCYWDCNPLQTQMDDAILAHQGYSNKVFEGIKVEFAEFDEFEYPILDLDEILHDSDAVPSTVDEIIAVAGMSTLDDCGVQYDYDLNSIAAESILIDIENGEYDDDREVVDSIDGDAEFGITETIRRLYVEGDDGRQQLSGIQTYSAVGIITLRDKPWCTGTLISKRWVITAAHCVHQGRGGNWHGRASEFKFHPGIKKTLSKHQTDNHKESKQEMEQLIGYKAIYIRTFNQWIQKGDSKYDIALIKLERDVTLENPIFPWTIGHRNIQLGDKLHQIGYPGEKDAFTAWYQYCPYDYAITTDILYSSDCDHTGGMSGGPVYEFVRNENHFWPPFSAVIRCIISHSNKARHTNACARLTPNKIATLRRWMVKY